MTIGKKTIYQMMVGIAVLLIIGTWNFDFLNRVYFAKQATSLGIILNSFIVTLFLLGLFKIITALRHYSFEEEQVDIFIEGSETDDRYVLSVLSPDSIIYRRHRKTKNLFDKKVPINHGAIVSAMLAEESLYLSFPKFVNNILILSGVFGTIVSLILALTGAGAVLKSSSTGEGMWLIIHGMNTALNTTATAIVCFFFFTYFFHKLTDVQTYVFGKIEKAVMLYIVPEFAFDSETVNYNTQKMIKNLEELAESINERSRIITDAVSSLNEHNAEQAEKTDLLAKRQGEALLNSQAMVAMLEKIRETLEAGFRLK
jgi:hypothetical protein